MWASKLGRMEKVEWQPPYLTFSIERHGATVKGSTRAELQNWQVDTSHRSLNPNEPVAIVDMRHPQSLNLDLG